MKYLLALLLSVNLYATYHLIRWTPIISAYSIMTYENGECVNEISHKVYDGLHCSNYDNDFHVYAKLRNEIPPNPLFKMFMPKAYWDLK